MLDDHNNKNIRWGRFGRKGETYGGSARGGGRVKEKKERLYVDTIIYTNLICFVYQDMRRYF